MNLPVNCKQPEDTWCFGLTCGRLGLWGPRIRAVKTIARRRGGRREFRSWSMILFLASTTWLTKASLTPTVLEYLVTATEVGQQICLSQNRRLPKQP